MDLTVVFPCLNESETLAFCLEEVDTALRDSGIEYEVVVADNGSTDGSRDIAAGLGARVVSVPERGYGAALKGGIRAARGDYVMFADADGSYCLNHAADLYRLAREREADMAVASRMRGTIEPGAMPFLHRFVGTPLLTLLINLLFRGRVSDCNSGFRCLRRTAFEQWDIQSDGMEFASELLIKALKHKSRFVEMPSGLRQDRRSRAPHLRTWRDGMRHLLFILSERPELFEWVGLIILIVSSLLQIAAFAAGPTRILVFDVFDYHTQTLLIPAACAGMQMYVFSCFLFLSGREKPTWCTRRVLALDEAHLFFLLLGLVVAGVGGLLFVLWEWYSANFSGLNLIRMLLFVTHFLCVLGFLIVGLLGVHVFRSRYGSGRVGGTSTSSHQG